MNYSLINITKKHDNGLIDGVWIQHCTAVDLDEAIRRARSTESKNTGGKYGGGIEVAVVEALNISCPNYSVFRGLKRLDKFNSMHCYGCNFYDKNDLINAFGTCEPQDIDFHCTHECNLTNLEIKSIESLTGKKQSDN